MSRQSAAWWLADESPATLVIDSYRSGRASCCAAGIFACVLNHKASGLLVSVATTAQGLSQQRHRAWLGLRLGCAFAPLWAYLVQVSRHARSNMPVHVCVCAGVVDAVLIPEVPFTLKGEHGLCKYLEGVLEKKGHCVVCIAEGAGQVRAGLGTGTAHGSARRTVPKSSFQQSPSTSFFTQPADRPLCFFIRS